MHMISKNTHKLKSMFRKLASILLCVRLAVVSGASGSACLLSQDACLCAAPAATQPVAPPGVPASGELASDPLTFFSHFISTP